VKKTISTRQPTLARDERDWPYAERFMWLLLFGLVAQIGSFASAYGFHGVVVDLLMVGATFVLFAMNLDGQQHPLFNRPHRAAFAGGYGTSMVIANHLGDSAGIRVASAVVSGLGLVYNLAIRNFESETNAQRARQIPLALIATGESVYAGAAIARLIPTVPWQAEVIVGGSVAALLLVGITRHYQIDGLPLSGRVVAVMMDLIGLIVGQYALGEENPVAMIAGEWIAMALSILGADLGHQYFGPFPPPQIALPFYSSSNV